MAQLKGTDFFHMAGLLSDDEVQIQNMAYDFVTDEVLPVITKHYREGTFPTELISKMGQLGFYGANLPEKYGCAGLNNVAYGLLMQELERGDSGVRSFASVQGGLVMYPIHAYGSEDQRQYWLPKLATGEKIGCFGLTEADHGSDPGGMETKCRKDGSDWIIHGTKMWITNGTMADVAIVWAKDEKGEVQGFLVEKGMKGYSAPEMLGKLSLRASVTSELVLDEVRVKDATHRLPNGTGLKAPLGCLSQARYGIAWGGLGAAMACYEAAVDYAKSRTQFGKPIAGFQLVQKKLADMLAGITKGQLLALQLGRMKDRDEAKFYHISLGKRENIQLARDCARTAREILAANGILDDYPVMRHMMNIESVYTYEGTHDMHTLILGEQITGIPAYR